MKRLPLFLVVVASSLVAAAAADAYVHVARGETVNELRVVGQDVRVDGRVRGPVLVVAGTLQVGPTGEVANITIIGGKIETAPGARLEGDLFQIGGSLPALSGWRLAVALVIVLVLRTLAVWLVILAAGAFARTGLFEPLTDRLRAGPARTLLTGLLASLGLLALSVFAAVTLVGLPVAFVLWGGLIVALVVGVAVACEALQLGRARRGLLAAFAIPLVGDALLALALAAGLGALLRWLGAPAATIARRYA